MKIKLAANYFAVTVLLLCSSFSRAQVCCTSGTLDKGGAGGSTKLGPHYAQLVWNYNERLDIGCLGLMVSNKNSHAIFVILEHPRKLDEEFGRFELYASSESSVAIVKLNEISPAAIYLESTDEPKGVVANFSDENQKAFPLQAGKVYKRHESGLSLVTIDRSNANETKKETDVLPTLMKDVADILKTIEKKKGSPLINLETVEWHVSPVVLKVVKLRNEDEAWSKRIAEEVKETKVRERDKE